MGTMTWQPKWWNEEKHGTAWSRVKDALKRDWEQTKSDVHAGGKDIGQDVGDTVKQATGKEPIPARGQRNWDECEMPLAYGFGARDQYGNEHKQWNDRLETTLKTEWEQGARSTGRGWDDVKQFVKRGYEHVTR